MFSSVGNAKLVFDSIYTGIFVIDDDGSNFIRLIKKSIARDPRWSPDGKQIVFERVRFINANRSVSSIWIMDTDGTNLRQITAPVPGSESDSYPSFSPDGQQILFVRYQARGKNQGLNILNLETGQIRKISEIVPRWPDWSSDGQQIVFSSNGDLWIMDADGNNARQLIPGPEGVMNIVQSRPRWSPDGQQILYTQYEFISQQVGKVRAHIPKAYRYMICDRNGENIQALNIPENLKSTGVDWMDNGESVVFSATEIELNKLDFVENLTKNIYKYHIATEKITQIGDDRVEGYSIDWISGSALPVSPKGKMQTQWGKVKKGSSGPQ
jgi:Tol biopolymer transport system component